MAVTNRILAGLWPGRIVGGLLVAVLTAQLSTAAVLPEDRLDILYHSFDGGGVTIDGPSVLVRKNIKETVSVYAN